MTTATGSGATFSQNIAYQYSTAADKYIQIQSYTSTVNGTAKTTTYTYDSRGNITKMVVGGIEHRYVYDNVGQLIREDNGLRQLTFVYEYDNAGNIYERRTYALTAEGGTPTTLYSTDEYYYYGGALVDQLTGYNGEDNITYDSIGNPLTYYNGASYTFTWQRGRQLATATKGSYNLSFTYNDAGIRTSKTVNGVKHTYYLSGSQIMAESYGTQLYIYLYDVAGSPIGMRYRTSSMEEGVFHTYWYEKNLQGDVIGVYNESGARLISYDYDAWGRMNKGVGNAYGVDACVLNNPFTYRGYYYDAETECYYASSHYYGSAFGRWMNAGGKLSDAGVDIPGCNLFAYCFNHPVNMNDHPAIGPNVKWSMQHCGRGYAGRRRRRFGSSSWLERFGCNRCRFLDRKPNCNSNAWSW